MGLLRETQEAIANEINKTFSSLAAKIDVFQITQDSYVESLIPKLQPFFPHLDDVTLKQVAALYGICLTDESLRDYTPQGFAEDVAFLNEIIQENENKSETEPGAPTEEEIDEENDDEIKSKEDLKSVPSLEDQGYENWSDRLQKATAEQSPLIRGLTAYYQSNIDIFNFITALTNDIVLHNVNQRIELAISSILIREHIIPLLDRLYSLYLNSGIDIDLRFLIAQIQYALETYLDNSVEFKNFKKRFDELKQVYPLGKGADLYWDMSKLLVYDKYYEPLKKMLEPIINDQIREREESAKAIKNILDAPKPRQGSTESIRSQVDSLIFESVRFGRPFQGEQRIKAQRLIATVLKRMALEEFGKQDIPHMEKYKEYFMKEFFEPIMKEYPQFLLPFIDFRLYRDFAEDPLAHFEKNKDYILNQFWFKMRKMGYVPRGTPNQIAAAFAGLLQDVLNDPRVKSFDA